MNTAKQEIQNLLLQLPDNCTLEDIQYHLYVVEKIRHGIAVAEQQGAVPQIEAERRLQQWLAE